MLITVLNDGGFEGEKLVEAVSTGPRADEIKATLRKSNADAIALGICGAPTFQVGPFLVWVMRFVSRSVPLLISIFLRRVKIEYSASCPLCKTRGAN